MLALTAFYQDPLTLFVTGMFLMILFFWYFATEIERRKRNVGTVLLIGVCSLCLLAVTPPSERLKGGIDILGGSSFSLRIQPQEAEDGTLRPITNEQVQQAISVIDKRLNSMGTAEPQIARQGEDRISLQMPGVEPEESARIRQTLEKVAKLELREVSPRNDEVGPDGKTLAQRVADGTEIVPGYRAYIEKNKDQEGTEFSRPILLSRRMALGGADIANATPSPSRADAVSVTLNSAGTDKMIKLTTNMRKRVDRLAIVLDGEVISAPTVNETLGKNFEVTGMDEPGEVQNLANALMNPLENALVVESFSTVSATLGSAVVQQGIWAGIIGLAITFVFILLYYRTAGLVAAFGLIVNGIILFGVMAMFGFTFSLPGICGIILSIGMAVDANVLIYERLREEIGSGKQLKTAIGASYDKAFTAIFDANITSLITAIILYATTTGSIRGFAVTLTIGIIASMFSAILATRVLFRWGIDIQFLNKLSFLNLIRSSTFNFLGKRRLCGMISVAVFAACLIGFAVRKERALGVDFTGGTILQFQLGKEVQVPLEDVKKALATLSLKKAAYPQEVSNIATGTLLTVRADTADAQAIEDKLREAIPALGAKKTDDQGESAYVIQASKEEISSLTGSDFIKESLIALCLGLIGIFLYITVRFEVSFAVGGFIAILHDVIISVGLIVLFGGELSLIHVGAILTIAGYSINDTIVVFDRIRDNLKIQQGSTESIMNEAINATLSRTILTSATTIVTVAILSFFGGSGLRDFSLMILVGLLVGTYSSVFVASPITLWWSNRKGGSLRKDVLATTLKAETLSAAP